ncbi:MAG: hypothetical protein FWC50_11350, partial [Planctomycetaceae bacterium]|nr:hypothetical protein [Planctomycetaceae bacterium]
MKNRRNFLAGISIRNLFVAFVFCALLSPLATGYAQQVAAHADSASVPAKSPGNASRTFVILVAVQDYMREKALHFTKSDAMKFRDELIRYNIAKEDVFLLTTGDVSSGNLATKDRIEEVIGAVLGVAKEGDTIIIYLGGHGAEVNGVPYFAPLNAGGSQASLVSIGDIIEAFGQSKASFKMMIV